MVDVPSPQQALRAYSSVKEYPWCILCDALRRGSNTGLRIAPTRHDQRASTAPEQPERPRRGTPPSQRLASHGAYRSDNPTPGRDRPGGGHDPVSTQGDAPECSGQRQARSAAPPLRGTAAEGRPRSGRRPAAGRTSPGPVRCAAVCGEPTGPAAEEQTSATESGPEPVSAAEEETADVPGGTQRQAKGPAHGQARTPRWVGVPRRTRCAARRGVALPPGALARSGTTARCRGRHGAPAGEYGTGLSWAAPA